MTPPIQLKLRGSLTKTEAFRGSIFFYTLFASGAVLSSCTPRVELALPEKPIEINITAKIDHEVRVKVERDVQELVVKQKELF